MTISESSLALIEADIETLRFLGVEEETKLNVIRGMLKCAHLDGKMAGIASVNLGPVAKEIDELYSTLEAHTEVRKQ